MGKLGSVYDDIAKLSALVVERWAEKVEKDHAEMARRYEANILATARDPAKLQRMRARLSEWYHALRDVAPIIAAAFAFAKLARRPRAIELLQAVAALAQR